MLFKDKMLIITIINIFLFFFYKQDDFQVLSEVGEYRILEPILTSPHLFCLLKSTALLYGSHYFTCIARCDNGQNNINSVDKQEITLFEFTRTGRLYMVWKNGRPQLFFKDKFELNT